MKPNFLKDIPDHQLRIVFYVGWFALALPQAAWMELFNDEAYYWAYGTALDWGYFDHPPMIALLTKFGSALWHHELGVRLFPVLLSGGTIWLMEKIVRPANLLLFYALISSVAVLYILGIIAFPDSPLLFFSALFFYFFEKYIEKISWKNAVLLALSMALMLYSKYHGILVIGFAVLSNLSLLKRPTFWAACVLGALLFAPHLYWQYAHGFPSVQYHFFERSTDPTYHPEDTLAYLVSQPFIFGPFVGIWLFYALFVFRPARTFERALKWSGIGVLAFFLAMTLKDQVEGNWTIIALTPLVFAGYRLAEERARAQRLIFALWPYTFVLILAAKVYCVWDFLPFEGGWPEMRHNRTWARQIEQLAGERPVAFMNSYKFAAKYTFYTGHPAFSLNNAMGRKNQYTVWDSEAAHQGREVVLILNYPEGGYPDVETVKGTFRYAEIQNFRSFGNVKITPNPPKWQIKRGEEIHLDVSFAYTNDQPRDAEANPDYPVYVSFVAFQRGSRVAEVRTDLQITNEMLGSGDAYPLSFAPDLAPGQYTLLLSTKPGWLPSEINGGKLEVEVVE